MHGQCQSHEPIVRVNTVAYTSITEYNEHILLRSLAYHSASKFSALAPRVRCLTAIMNAPPPPAAWSVTATTRCKNAESGCEPAHAQQSLHYKHRVRPGTCGRFAVLPCTYAREREQRQRQPFAHVLRDAEGELLSYVLGAVEQGFGAVAVDTATQQHMALYVGKGAVETSAAPDRAACPGLSALR